MLFSEDKGIIFRTKKITPTSVETHKKAIVNHSQLYPGVGVETNVVETNGNTNLTCDNFEEV